MTIDVRDKRRYAAYVRWKHPGALRIGARLADEQILELCRTRRKRFGRPADENLVNRARQILHGIEAP